jgi:5-methylcytosine-specific restriction endonuclease McrA
MSRALVLNATYEPLCVVASRRALILVMSDKAEILHAGRGLFRSEKVAYPEPSVVRLTHFVKVPFRARVALNRRAVFARDGNRCQYCGAAAENLDHVVPRSKGGPHTWENVVAACRPCNTRKEDRLLADSGLKLRNRPAAPRARAWVVMAAGASRPDWEPYLEASLSAAG